ncbi:AAA family ATPase [Pseudomonas sp. EA_105y_Pfl2_R69]|uniref:AAA family ATPase n=1 Tax=Pseudomonas sp. EA_105y_Pfl2_R69 TaxID=3088683 RepID=UPI0030DBEB98
MKWKISRIEISSFKAFRSISLDLNSASLLTLDGPNGFGKTSIFDAIELLLTGKIARVQRLFKNVMTAGKRKYDDNLFWNIRSRNNDLYIKIEFKKDDTSLILARHASPEVLWTKENNRGNDFTPFKLYELNHFEQVNFNDLEISNESIISEHFGENFQENYSFLNYLEQGQSEYLFATRLDDRKAALESLFQSSAIVSEIEKCRKLERRLTQKLSKERRAEETQLDDQVKSLRAMLESGLEGVEYKKLSTAKIQPNWDKQELFTTYSREAHDNYNQGARKIIELIPFKQEIKTRKSNLNIENYISTKNDLLRALVQVGKTTGRLGELSVDKSRINALTASLRVLDRGAVHIEFQEIQTIPDWNPDEFKDLELNIAKRMTLSSSAAANATVVAEMNRLKNDLLEKHFKLTPTEASCPLCSQDWGTHQELLNAIEKRSNEVSDSMGEDGKRLLEVTVAIAKDLEKLAERLTNSLRLETSNYDHELHELLLEHKEKIGRIKIVGEQLEQKGIPYPDTHTVDPLEEEKRFEELISLFRAQKKEDTAELPDSWQSAIEESFEHENDFYVLEAQSVQAKLKYIALKANEAQSNALKTAVEKLNLLRSELKAAKQVKDRIVSLREVLQNVEKSYADHTISEIELVFHIYSGRLIQNYQRGLGLFIESKDGNQLRFATAERSEHDAMLSMSSGQVSALSLAFFLSLNRVYSDVPIIMIDDPAQSLDEVNIASLTDLLRCELKDRQLIVSSHEDDISSYMRYRFARAGLPPLTLNMQSLSRTVAPPSDSTDQPSVDG